MWLQSNVHLSSLQDEATAKLAGQTVDLCISEFSVHFNFDVLFYRLMNLLMICFYVIWHSKIH
jgi:hypothetical protein